MSRPSPSCWFCHQDIWWAVQAMKLLTVPYAPVPCYVPLRPKCLPQHPILEHSQYKFFTQCDRPTSHPYTNAKLCILKSLCFWTANWTTKDSASNENRQSLVSISLTFLMDAIFGRVLFPPNFFIFPQFLRIYYSSLCCDIVLYFVHEAWKET